MICQNEAMIPLTMTLACPALSPQIVPIVG